jgi:GNAT superfamily N-acetyltransferase
VDERGRYHGRQLRREADGACYLGMLTVDPARQAGGIGRGLLERSEAIAREWGCGLMRMTVISMRSELIAYYERKGYRLTGKTVPFAPGPGIFGDPKVAGLAFAELEKALP